jgi:arabinosaccharide transport system substrate-binding protein
MQPDSNIDKPRNTLLTTVRAALSPGGWVIVSLAALSTLLVLMRADAQRSGLDMWVFARPHHEMYVPNVESWNASQDPDLNLYLLSLPALERRMSSGFLSDTPVADLMEADVRVASRAFTGPLEDVGFLDLTDRITESGILEEINAPSFTPWTSRGRIFGLPHDVHPVMLAYRADLVEAAGIDVSEIETWDDFIRLMSPLMADADGEGSPDRYLLNVWETQIDTIEAFVLQAGGSYFDERERVAINSEVNAEVIATLATWVTGPGRIAVDAQEFTASGNRLKLEGFVVASIMPDWLGGVWKQDMGDLAGKVKLMSLPAWKEGGCRTTVWGGTMLGIARSTKDPEAAWEMAKHLYLSEELAKQLYESNGIISPIRRLWDREYYDKSDPYFRGQAPGRMYIDLAPSVPRRTSSPFNQIAKERVRDALSRLREHAEAEGLYTVEALLPEARRQLESAHADIQGRVDRNVFLKEGVEEQG